MSEIMQRWRPETPKPSKFAESRSHLSSSCSECHRRKQKCDKKQPCGNCARRYPPPQCTYRRCNLGVKSSTATLNTSSGTSDIGGQASGYSTYPGQDVNPREDLPHQTPLLSNVDSAGNGLQSTGNITAPLGFLDSIEPVSAYQGLLTAMTSFPYYSDHEEFLGLSQEVGQAGQVDQGSWDSNSDNVIAMQRLRWASHNSEAGGPPAYFSINSVDPLHFLPLTPTVQNTELFNICGSAIQLYLDSTLTKTRSQVVKLITKYVVSIDGNPSPNYYNDHWVPWAIKSPVLAQLAIYTASCYQSELQKVPANQSPLALGLKARSIEILNEMLRSEHNSTSDEAIAAVVYLITNEWYWGIQENVQAHMSGLREMVKLRGGVEGDMNRFLRQMIILCDYHISCSNDYEPSFHHITPDLVTIPIYMSTPFLSSKERFSNHTKELNIDKETAIILDDMRFLTLSVLKLESSKPLEQDLTKLIATSTWIRDRIIELPKISAPPNSPSEFIYASTRLAAIIYCKAIVNRTSLSQACTMEELNALWGVMWRVRLTQWKQIPGIFLWILLSATQAAQNTPHGRFLKSMIKTSSFYIGLAEWPVVDGTFRAFVRMQRWLRIGWEETGS
ncbi:uncharacterized protein BP5553_05056 [Venustampulla echinocandica]|uniref:Zn(2)-C6 fungal-type domain-containing protein n=1 Tax=Venustampulla echinocandica TaxID=2656787 RepID=A0A370TQ27_9HELO|nr:uncharacterized protein BP5553_05056 [Venustampulla echinocandica]RDL37623.1 hypothetical protein BP5553_05056 [Venustampulla echinocandica]